MCVPNFHGSSSISLEEILLQATNINVMMTPEGKRDEHQHQLDSSSEDRENL